MHSSWGSNLESLPNSPSSSDSSFDEDEVNRRITPHWPSHRQTLRLRGFRLDTVRDVKEFYKCQSESHTSHDPGLGYLTAFESLDDDALCPDAGLRDNLFRGTRIRDGARVMIKAVHLYSREYDVIRLLSTSPLRDDPMNHTIPVLDLIEVVDDDIVFIVMEEWSSQLITDTPCCLRLFLAALRQCIEHAVFMHQRHIAHLDISLRNLLTDYKGHYAYIDFELSRRYTGMMNPSIFGYRGTEIPPECERGEATDPYKVDVWALAVLILRACKFTGYYLPELMQLVKPMLHEAPQHRPSVLHVLQAFDKMVSTLAENRLRLTCPNAH
ncbi:MAP/microtubule affinity-regulating kinase 4 [Hypsizygus marmoreus]|uniref:MAP/microtubule affinity-regulating kinase 4 n=1 Tax=Hypsizygus marmoreus TaxID=39966 RepID=A0A369JKZ6_HYPMA|nr:MAP/microtubule affinity-regulating kinase 4 [Hypsizygus marmoreus]